MVESMFFLAPQHFTALGVAPHNFAECSKWRAGEIILVAAPITQRNSSAGFVVFVCLFVYFSVIVYCHSVHGGGLPPGGGVVCLREGGLPPGGSEYLSSTDI